jgi:hypothetical protein
MVYVTPWFVRAALYARFNEVKAIWASSADSALFDKYVDHLCSLGELEGDVNHYVDNFLINGQFVCREHDLFDGSWEAFCEANGVIFDDNFCCTNLGI